MKKILSFSAIVVTILAFAIMSEKFTFARITDAAADRDVWCVGVSGSELCVDSSGNFIPTTDDVADLGTSSLQFQDLYLDGTLYTDDISADAGTITTLDSNDITAESIALTGTDGISVSTTALSSVSITLKGAVVTLSTRSANEGDIFYQTSDYTLYIATQNITENLDTCAGTACYVAFF